MPYLSKRVALRVLALALTSILMVGQYFLEKRFSRGVSSATRMRTVTVTGGHGKEMGV